MEVDQPRQPYALAPDEGEGWWVRGNRFTFKGSGREVGSGFAVVETCCILWPPLQLTFTTEPTRQCTSWRGN